MTGKLDMDFAAMDKAISDAKLLVMAAQSQNQYATNDEIKAENFGTLPDGTAAGTAVVNAETTLAKSLGTLHQYLSDLEGKLEVTRKSTSETEADNQWKFVKLLQAG